jgi:hypothetical protein
MTNVSVNYLNIGLIVLSCAAAFAWPFQLFLFSYAVLGPAHYLTEIAWLHDRDYFVRPATARRVWLLVVGATLAVVVYGIAVTLATGRTVDPRWEMGLFYLAFAAACAAGLNASPRTQILLAVVALAWLSTLNAWRYYAVIAFFLITIIHVGLFTAAFMLYGALKSRSASALGALGVFVACTASFFLYVPAAGTPVSSSIRDVYGSFNALNAELLKLFGLGTGTTPREIYESGEGLAVMRFIAFAYTYHYLNWFSKTSIIRWHDPAKRQAAWIAALWLVALALYFYDYTIGMTFLYSLSILHVMLEFPLNHQTLAGIVTETSRMFARPAAIHQRVGRAR